MNPNILIGIICVLLAVLFGVVIVVLRHRPKTINFEALVEAAVKDQEKEKPKENSKTPPREQKRVIPPGVSPNPAPDATQLLSHGEGIGELVARDDRNTGEMGRSVRKLTPIPKAGDPEVQDYEKATLFLAPQGHQTEMLVSPETTPKATRVPESPEDLWKYLNALSQSAGRTLWVCLTIQWFDAEGESQVFCTLSEIPAYRNKAEKKYFHPTSGKQVPAFTLKGYKIAERDASGQLTDESDHAIVQDQINLLALPMARVRFPKVSEDSLRSLLPPQ
jgi:hypothetical protein